MRATSFFVAVFLGFVLSVALQDEARGDDTPACATHNEWESVQEFMRPWRVAEIVGNDGWAISTENPDTFARGYNLCWTGNFGKVWYWQDSALSFRKDIV